MVMVMLSLSKTIIGSVLLLISFGGSTASAESSRPTAQYERAKIVSIIKSQGTADTARVVVLSGAERGETLTANIGIAPGTIDISPPQYRAGDTVLLSIENAGNGPVYIVVDHYRLSFAFWIIAIIMVLAIIFAGWRGIGSLMGLILSVIVLAGFVIPQILHGQSPYLATAIGITVISFIGIFVAHGLSKRTALALLSTYITLIVAVILSVIVVHGMNLTGVTGEDTFYLTQAKPELNIQGLLLCGMLISIIGILDDITVGQATSVEELYKADPKFSVRDAYRRGLKIGREHISSLINTLGLVFVGTSFLMITYLSALSPYPWLVNLNSGLVMQEIARALVGSVALILAVPIATILAAKFLKPTQHSKSSRTKTSD
jgi:uncharacterized membrane protein